jgi:hypothetical protein
VNVQLAGNTRVLRPWLVSENSVTLETEDSTLLVTLYRDDLARLLAACDKVASDEAEDEAKEEAWRHFDKVSSPFDPPRADFVHPANRHLM